MKPAIAKIDYFAIIVNHFQNFTIFGMRSILNVAVFLDLLLHRNKFAL